MAHERTSYLYARAKLHNAVRTLATMHGTLRPRLIAAYRYLSPLMESDLPFSLRAEFRTIKDALTKNPSLSQYTATGLDKPARAIKGTLNLQDLFGETKMRIAWTINDPINPGMATIEKGRGFEFNQFRDIHRWVRATDQKDMQATFSVKSILYEDGSRKDFD